MLNLHIVNDRYGRPEGSQFTFINDNGCSTIDYFIVSQPLFDFVFHFAVEPVTESCHLPIRMFMRCSVRNESVENKVIKDFYDLNENNCEAFCQNLGNRILEGCLDDVESILDDVDADTNIVVDKFEEAV